MLHHFRILASISNRSTPWYSFARKCVIILDRHLCATGSGLKESPCWRKLGCIEPKSSGPWYQKLLGIYSKFVSPDSSVSQLEAQAWKQLKVYWQLTFSSAQWTGLLVFWEQLKDLEDREFCASWSCTRSWLSTDTHTQASFPSGSLHTFKSWPIDLLSFRVLRSVQVSCAGFWARSRQAWPSTGPVSVWLECQPGLYPWRVAKFGDS